MLAGVMLSAMNSSSGRLPVVPYTTGTGPFGGAQGMLSAAMCSCRPLTLSQLISTSRRDERRSKRGRPCTDLSLAFCREWSTGPVGPFLSHGSLRGAHFRSAASGVPAQSGHFSVMVLYAVLTCVLQGKVVVLRTLHYGSCPVRCNPWRAAEPHLGRLCLQYDRDQHEGDNRNGHQCSYRN